MRIYRIDHVGQVAPELEPQVELLTGLFGFKPVRSWDNPAEGCRGTRLEIPGSWGHAWEVLAPSGDGAVQTYLDDHGGRAGLHHVAAEVPDLAAARSELESRGIKASGDRWLEASLSPPEHGPGVLFRLRGPGDLGMCGDENAAPATDRPPDAPSLGIVGLDHVCQAFPDRDELARWYADLAG